MGAVWDHSTGRGRNRVRLGGAGQGRRGQEVERASKRDRLQHLERETDTNTWDPVLGRGWGKRKGSNGEEGLREEPGGKEAEGVGVEGVRGEAEEGRGSGVEKGRKGEERREPRIEERKVIG